MVFLNCKLLKFNLLKLNQRLLLYEYVYKNVLLAVSFSLWYDKNGQIIENSKNKVQHLLKHLWQHSPLILTGCLQDNSGHSTGRHCISPCYEKEKKRIIEKNNKRDLKRIMYARVYMYTIKWIILYIIWMKNNQKF